MKIITKAEFQMTDRIGEYLPIAETSFEYGGEVAQCNRAAASQAKQAANDAGSTAAQYGANAQGINAALVPGLEQQWQNPTGFTPQQENQQLVAGEQGAGGALSGVTGQANLETARTGNSAGYTGSLDEAMREKGRMLSQNALNVKTESAHLAQQKQQNAGRELAGLYGVNSEAQLKGMGLQNQDINTEIEAGKSGWFQNMTGMINAVGGAARGAAGLGLRFPGSKGSGGGGGE